MRWVITVLIPKGGRGVPRDRVDGTNMEGLGEGNGPQIGNDRAPQQSAWVPEA